MEELLVVILQFLFEFTLNVLGNWPFDWVTRNRSTPEPELTSKSGILWFIGGCVLAAVTLPLWSHALIKLPYLRMLNVVLAPVASAS